jgi:hypothetical protein
MDHKETRREGVGWIHLAQDGDQRRVFLERAMKLWFYKMLEISRLAK